MSDSQPRFEHLNATNYAVWKIRMQAYLTHRGWWKVVKAPAPTSVDGADHDEKALSCLLLCVTDQFLHVISKSKTAHDAWETLKKMHQSKTLARRLQLRRELTSLRMGSESITAYFARARAIHDSLLEIEDSVSTNDLVCSLLAGLPRAFDTVVTFLSAPSEKDKELEDVYSQLLNEEQRIASRRGSSHDQDQEQSKALTA
jgi:gag-polypeptide of LTR copia-type/Domain of unknown function (DUF4219)